MSAAHSDDMDHLIRYSYSSHKDMGGPGIRDTFYRVGKAYRQYAYDETNGTLTIEPGKTNRPQQASASQMTHLLMRFCPKQPTETLRRFNADWCRRGATLSTNTDWGRGKPRLNSETTLFPAPYASTGTGSRSKKTERMRGRRAETAQASKRQRTRPPPSRTQGKAFPRSYGEMQRTWLSVLTSIGKSRYVSRSARAPPLTQLFIRLPTHTPKHLPSGTFGRSVKCSRFVHAHGRVHCLRSLQCRDIDRWEDIGAVLGVGRKEKR
ncbi:hypothetical protein DB88DRAFT_473391 [Papiliotrema laurentii]|uniref:Uncharacterized protein n=1 Tax=Papiliotrema laurentii TaxID=5418 RepID=A0AAD9FLJ4_PAPLA|nr:hypothetical protein DB88DRAFT_473391 [Papiliotrema laurentii]